MSRRYCWHRIGIAFALVVAASASTASSQFQDPLDIHNHHKPWGKYGPTVTYPSPTKVMNLLSGRPNQQPHRRRVAQRDVSSRNSRLNDINLSVNMPSGPWVTLDPEEMGSQARYLISRSKPTIIISLAGEQPGADAESTNRSLLADSQATMKSLGANVLPRERQVSAGGIEGVAYSAIVVDGKFTTYYALWVAAHNGYNYKLAAYGDGHDKKVIDAAMLDFVRGIKPIQRTRVARTSNSRQPR